MSTAVAGFVQLAGGVALAPLLPGVVQTAKGRLQGRRGPSPVQPYRELRRLWRRSRVTPEPRSIVYELAPPVVAAAVLLALLLLPVGSHGASSPGYGAGAVPGSTRARRCWLAVPPLPVLEWRIDHVRGRDEPSHARTLKKRCGRQAASYVSGHRAEPAREPALWAWLASA